MGKVSAAVGKVLLGAIVGSVLAAPAVAYANYRRIGPAICAKYGVNNPAPNTLYVDGYTRWVNTGGNNEVLVCPFPEDTTLDRGGITNLYVDLNNNGPLTYSAYAQACASYASGAGAGGDCGTPYYSNNYGWASLQPDRAVWAAHPYDYVSIKVVLPPSSSTLNGFLAN